jgi:hypothetical protein
VACVMYKPSMLRSKAVEEFSVKLFDEVAVPMGVVTAIGPVVAAEGTVAVICVAL